MRVHVGEAVLKALAVAAERKARSAIAFPNSRRHRSLVAPIRTPLERLGITLFWVDEDGTVSANEPHEAN